MAEEKRRATAEILQALKDADLKARREAAYAIHHAARELSAEEIRQAVPVLISALRDKDQQVRYHAASALSRIGPEARDAIPALIRGLESWSAQVRYRSAYASVRLSALHVWLKTKPAAKQAVPILKKPRDRDTDKRVKAAAARAGRSASRY